MVGIITLEDIVEEILGTEIIDETDPTEGFHNVVRDPELARLKTIHTAKVQEQSLSDEEVQSIAIYLFTNVPQIQRLYKDMSDLQKLVRTSAVISMTRRAEVGSKPSHEDYLYRRGKMSNTCTLILSGTVDISDEEGSSSKTRSRGPWSSLAAEALEAPEGNYMSDFTASISSETIRFLRMSNFHSNPAVEKEHQHQRLKKTQSVYTSTTPAAKSMGVSAGALNHMFSIPPYRSTQMMSTTSVSEKSVSAHRSAGSRQRTQSDHVTDDEGGVFGDVELLSASDGIATGGAAAADNASSSNGFTRAATAPATAAASSVSSSSKTRSKSPTPQREKMSQRMMRGFSFSSNANANSAEAKSKNKTNVSNDGSESNVYSSVDTDNKDTDSGYDDLPGPAPADITPAPMPMSVPQADSSGSTSNSAFTRAATAPAAMPVTDINHTPLGKGFEK